MSLAVDDVDTKDDWSGTDSATLTLSAASGSPVFLVVHAEREGERPVVSTVTDTAGLTWQKRKARNWTHEAPHLMNRLEVWWAYAPDGLTDDVITVTMDRAVDDATMAAFGVTGFTGAPTFFPFDQNASLPASNILTNYEPESDEGPPSPRVFDVVTTAANTMLLGIVAAAFPENSGNVLTVTDGWTELAHLNNNGGDWWSNLVVQTKVVSVGQNIESVVVGGDPGRWGIIVDAIAMNAPLVIPVWDPKSEPEDDTSEPPPSEPPSSSSGETPPSEPPSVSASKSASEPGGPAGVVPVVQCVVVVRS